MRRDPPTDSDMILPSSSGVDHLSLRPLCQGSRRLERLRVLSRRDDPRSQVHRRNRTEANARLRRPVDDFGSNRELGCC